MRGKGIIRIFLVALFMACVYQLLFTFVTWRIESNALSDNNGNLNATEHYLDSIQETVALNLGFTSFTYRQCKERQINLGLDLQGGMNVVMEVSVPDVVKALSNQSKDAPFLAAISDGLKKQENSQADFITLFYASYKANNPKGSLAAIFATRENNGRITYNSNNDEVIQFLREESDKAIDRSFQILRTRIDKFGVTQPNIQRQQGTGRIVIELPGVREPERVRKLLQGTAKLEFWETYEFSEVYKNIEALNNAIAARNKAEKALGKTDTTATAASLTDTASAAIATAAASDTSSSLLNKIAGTEDTSTAGKKDSSSLAQAKDIAKFRKENPLFTVLVPNADPKDGKLGKGPMVGFALAKDTAQVNAYVNSEIAHSTLPRDLKLLWSAKPREDNRSIFSLIAIKTPKNSDNAPLDGDVITRANRNIDQFGQVEVTMAMNGEGARTWKKLTGNNIDRSVAIVLDNLVYSYPTVRSEIGGGVSSISGNFTINEAADLANILEAGKLPAPAKIIEEAVVGSSLGAEAISSGMWSALAGFIAVVLFMIGYYRKAGVLADIALFANVFFIFGVLASLQAVLTLPGIAGIVLTMGMAVDANVLIFERIKDELQMGKTLKLAIQDGYRHAYSAIFDSNVTTLLTAIILFTFGTGPIQGFATTLIIGILTSLLSAIFITRMVMDHQADKGKEISFYSGATKNLLRNSHIDFLGKRKIFYVISSIIILAGTVSFFTRGFELGVDFKGGRSFVIDFGKVVPQVEARESLRAQFESAPEVKTYGTAEKLKITTSYLIAEKGEESDIIVEGKLFEGLKNFLPEGTSYEKFKSDFVMSSQKVGPTIVDDIKQSAAYSVIFGILGIATFILIRFRNWQYSLGAAVSLIHDVLMMLSVFTLLHGILPWSMEIDQAFIAALLTVVGYSINDTVVVYDRLREQLRMHKGEDTIDVINDAVNRTLSRTIMTAFTTFLTILIIFIFGGEVIRGFSFALLIGMVIGTYSSIFVASSVVVDLLPKKNQATAKTETE